MKTERLATILSILGAVLTTASVIASIAQYRAADLQAKAAVVALMPQIEVRTLLEKIDSDNYTDRRIEISSDGGPIYNFELSRLSWIEFKVRNMVAYQQPIAGYYFAEYPTGHNKGMLTTLRGQKNNDQFFRFLNWVQPALGSDVEINEPLTLLRMSYTDAMRQESLYYVLVRGGHETHLSVDAGTKLWEGQSRLEQTNFPLDISDLASDSGFAKKVATWKTKVAEARKSQLSGR